MIDLIGLFGCILLSVSGIYHGVEEFSGVVVLAYAFMSNHFHIFIYVPSAEEIGEGDPFASTG